MAENNGRYILERQPEKLGQVMAALASGQSVLAVSKQTGLARNTVAAIRDMPATKQYEQITAQRLERINNTILDKVESKLAETGKESLGTLSISFCQFLDKRAMLLGTDSQAAEPAGISVDSILAELKALPATVQNVQVNVYQGQPGPALPGPGPGPGPGQPAIDVEPAKTDQTGGGGLGG
jgi:lambda repressor-like predicted transcriptional regulator